MPRTMQFRWWPTYTVRFRSEAIRNWHALLCPSINDTISKLSTQKPMFRRTCSPMRSAFFQFLRILSFIDESKLNVGRENGKHKNVYNSTVIMVATNAYETAWNRFILPWKKIHKRRIVTNCFSEFSSSYWIFCSGCLKKLLSDTHSLMWQSATIRRIMWWDCAQTQR